MKAKKISKILLASIGILALASCGNDDAKVTNTPNVSNNETSTNGATPSNSQTQTTKPSQPSSSKPSSSSSSSKPTQTTDKVENGVSLLTMEGGAEAATVSWRVVSGATYNVYYKNVDDSTYIKVDKELQQISGSVGKVYIPGLKKGQYLVKIEKDSTTYSITSNIAVSEQDRSGYAHFGSTEGVGAYNNDGTLKNNATVVYVSEETKNTVTAKIGSANVTGLINILKAQKDSSTPLDVRIIGKIGTSHWKPINYSGDPKSSGELVISKAYTSIKDIEAAGLNTMDTSEFSTLDGLTNKLQYSTSEYDSYWNMADISAAKNVTVEGITPDSELYHWGFTWSRCNSIEVKNLVFTDNPEDACSFQGGSNNDMNYGRYWIHNNVFNRGKNYWDVVSEQDKHYGDGSTDFKYCYGITSSYNVFNNCKKTGLVGGSNDSRTKSVTFHHNYYNNVGSRLPLGRQANMHFYNNYYLNCSTCQDIRANAFVLSEANYFQGCGDAQKVSVDSTYTGTIIKSYNDIISGGTSKATVVTERDKTLSGNCKPDGSTNYTNFDTNPTLFYYDDVNNVSMVDNLFEASDVPKKTVELAGPFKGGIELYYKDSVAPQPTYNITFNTNGHGTKPSDIKDVSKITSLPSLSESGYKFGGWFTDSALTKKASVGDKITENTTLYAKWTKVSEVGAYTTLYDMTGKSETIPTTKPSQGWSVNSASDISSTLVNGTLTVTDTSGTDTNFTCYNINSKSEGKIKVTATINITNLGSKWSIIQLFDGSTGIALRLDGNKYWTLTTDGGATTAAQITTSAQAANSTVNIVLEVDINNSVITATVNGTTKTYSGYNVNSIDYIQFMTAGSAANRSFTVTNFKVETA